MDLRRVCGVDAAVALGCVPVAVADPWIQPTRAIQSESAGNREHWLALRNFAAAAAGLPAGALAPLSLLGAVILLTFFSILVLLPPLIEHVSAYRCITWSRSTSSTRALCGSHCRPPSDAKYSFSAP